jgi:antirestriction protein ArdC
MYNNKRNGYNRQNSEANRNEKTQRAIEHVIDAFRSGDIPAAIVHKKFGIPENVPMAQWSERNQMIATLHGTIDARGFQQWKTAGRSVKRGAKAFYILAPWTIRKKVTKLSEAGEIIIDNETGEPIKSESTIVIGYYDVPVFRAEDTEGEPLKYDQLDERKFDLAPVARSWGIDIRQIKYTGETNAYYSFGDNGDVYIAMAQDSEKTFCHELAHAAHHRLCNCDNLDFRKIPSWEQEVVAELSSGALLYLIGKKPEIGNHYKYIESQAKDSGIDMFAACWKVTETCQKIIDEIMEEAEKLQITETIAA